MLELFSLAQIDQMSWATIVLICFIALTTAAIHGATGVAGGFLLTSALALVIGVKPIVPVVSVALLISHSTRALLNSGAFRSQSFPQRYPARFALYIGVCPVIRQNVRPRYRGVFGRGDFGVHPPALLGGITANQGQQNTTGRGGRGLWHIIGREHWRRDAVSAVFIGLWLA